MCKVTNFNDLPVMLSPTQVGETLGISKNNAYVLVRKVIQSDCPEFTVLKLGTQYRINKQSFINWMQEPRVINF